MALTKTQRAVWERACALGGGQQAVALDEAQCAYLVARIVLDLGLAGSFPEVPANTAELYAGRTMDTLRLPSVPALPLFERLVAADGDADMYFACLAALHKARLKYETIMQTQQLPSLEQVGPRGLLQYGTVSPAALATLLIWRKWMFDIDNRAGQETGYLFEPVIANALGGTPASAAKSPVRRRRDQGKGRQVDCILGERAYEFKVRVTIAASGQGRWREELDFPADCQASGLTPVLVVLDSTANPKLAELEQAFLDAEGEVYVGTEAWGHLNELAGPTMSCFLGKYIRTPLDRLLREAPPVMPAFTARVDPAGIVLSLGAEVAVIPRPPAN